MHISNRIGDDVNATAVALTLIRQFGDKAASLVEKQVDECKDQPAIAEHWRKIAAAISILVIANLHMEIALDLLDFARESDVPPSLDQAIVTLGLRETADQGRADTLAGIVSANLRDHAEQRDLHEIRLSLSSRYAQLHKLTAENYLDMLR